MTDNTLIQQYDIWKRSNVRARRAAMKADIELSKLVDMADARRRTSTVINISRTNSVEITDQFRGSTKVFAPAFARRWKLVEKKIKS